MSRSCNWWFCCGNFRSTYGASTDRTISKPSYIVLPQICNKLTGENQCSSTVQHNIVCTCTWSRHIEAEISKPSFVSSQMVSYSSVLTAISKVWLWDKNMVEWILQMSVEIFSNERLICFLSSLTTSPEICVSSPFWRSWICSATI